MIKYFDEKFIKLLNIYDDDRFINHPLYDEFKKVDKLPIILNLMKTQIMPCFSFYTYILNRYITNISSVREGYLILYDIIIKQDIAQEEYEIIIDIMNNKYSDIDIIKKSFNKKIQELNDKICELNNKIS